MYGVAAQMGIWHTLRIHYKMVPSWFSASRHVRKQRQKSSGKNAPFKPGVKEFLWIKVQEIGLVKKKNPKRKIGHHELQTVESKPKDFRHWVDQIQMVK